MDMSRLAVGALAALAVGGVAYALVYPYISGTRRGEQRTKALVGQPVRNAAARQAAVSQTNRKEKIATSLRELESRQKEITKLTLERRLMQAGLDWDKKKFFLVSVIMGLVTAIVLMVALGNPIGAAVGMFVGSLGLPRFMLNYLKKRRIKRFTDELPNAMDVIVRGIRSGLPLNDCMRMIANEAQEPLKTEFRTIMEATTMGMPVGEAVMKLYERVPVPEANFFAIVINIQAKSGGNLSEVLNNLSRVIRDRKRMRGKISAMSMEAKASAAIIGSLPIVVGVLVYGTSPDYISLLWTTIHGRIWMGIGAFMMLLGVLVMRKMINFDI
ncbi:type II secretion system F family protein [Alsobacter sp. R-9]